jgi:hypothetical protein
MMSIDVAQSVSTMSGMIRQMLKLAVEAAKVEADRFLGLAEEPATPKAEPASVNVQPSKWSSPEFHIEVLKSASCPDCDKPKKAGSYRCKPCTMVAQKTAS